MTREEYQSIKGQLMIVPINMSRITSEDAANIVWRSIGDIGIGYGYPADENNVRMITHDDFNGPLAMTMLEADAGMASSKCFPLKIFKMGSLLASLLADQGAMDPKESEYIKELNEDYGDFYVITNGIIGTGAGVIGYPDLFEKVEEKLGRQNFYLVPSSIHEILLLPERLGPPDGLVDILRSINCAEVPKNEQLSDNLFYLDLEQREIKMLQEDGE